MQWYPAPAKLNLFLHVVGRREDGYHLLQTVFRMIDRCDYVGIALRADGQVCRAGEVPEVAEKDDLCLRAARLLQQHAPERFARGLGADIGLRKTLPIGAGLGGGSSDAATTLLVLNRLWGIGMPQEDMLVLAAALGADVPFFVLGRTALGEGVGERLEPLSVRSAWYLVLTPQVSVSTKEIFVDSALTRDTKPLKIPPFFPGSGRNDLEPVVTRRYAAVAEHLAWLRAQVPGARMTGSGACVFAEFAQEGEARRVLGRLPERMRGFVAQGLDSHPLQRMRF